MAKAKTTTENVAVTPPDFGLAEFRVQSTGPYCQNKFSEKARQKIMATQAAGGQAKSKRTREPKDFDECFRLATHRDKYHGWPGIPATAFRNALVSACRLVGFKMTHAKLTIFVQADGIDEDRTPLVKLSTEPEMHVAPVRNESGVVDIRARPIWESWEAIVRLQWDNGQFSLTDVSNLLARAGMQVGIGEGRPDSPNSNGLGWGTFRVLND